MDTMSLHNRIARLERQNRRLSIGLTTALLGVAVVSVAAWRPQQPDVIRARAIIIVDSIGRERVVLGAPIPEPPGRIAPASGMVIRDTAGFERFGVSLFPNGRMVMGLDAPRGTGDDRNRERINIVADERGGSYIRFLDRRTLVAGYLRLGDDNRMWLEFVDVRTDSIMSRRIGFATDQTIAQKR
jgi:hypothetical protein